MAGTANINIRIDRDLKERSELLLNDMGLNMTTAINMFLRQTLLRGKIPFEVCADPFYSRSNIQALEESARQAAEGRFVVKTLEELEQMANEQ